MIKYPTQSQYSDTEQTNIYTVIVMLFWAHYLLNGNQALVVLNLCTIVAERRMCKIVLKQSEYPNRFLNQEYVVFSYIIWIGLNLVLVTSICALLD